MDKQNPLLSPSTTKQAQKTMEMLQLESTSTSWSTRFRKNIQESSNQKNLMCLPSKTPKIVLFLLTRFSPPQSTVKPQIQMQIPNLCQDHHRSKFQLFHRHQTMSVFQSSTSFLTSSPPLPYNTDYPFICISSLFPFFISPIWAYLDN